MPFLVIFALLIGIVCGIYFKKCGKYRRIKPALTQSDTNGNLMNPTPLPPNTITKGNTSPNANVGASTNTKKSVGTNTNADENTSSETSTNSGATTNAITSAKKSVGTNTNAPPKLRPWIPPGVNDPKKDLTF